MAFLQKKRELKAAGIKCVGRECSGACADGQLESQDEEEGHGRELLNRQSEAADVQYNAEIPFEKQPAAGFYDVTEEQAKVFAAPVGSSLRALEGKRKQELEEIEDKKKKQKGNDGKSNVTAQFVAAREAQIKRLKEQEQVIRRRKLNLPMPQVGEAELEEIVKIGQAGESARELVRGEGASEGATGRLLGEYESLGQARMARTPRTESSGKCKRRCGGDVAPLQG